MDKFFYTPFANSGDKTTVPFPAEITGEVSYTTGYTVDYQQDPAIDPLTAKDVERRKMNQIIFDMTNALKELQAHAVPDFITPALNNGSPWSYAKEDLVRWNNGIENLTYISLVDSNTSEPSDITRWRKFNASSFPVGSLIAYDGSTLPNSWIWADGKTVGNALSNATNRANEDTLELFTLIWNSYPNSVRPIFNSNGTAGTRGASAAADWAANKAITVRDMRGIVPVGKDDMGGTAANRITVGGCGISGVTLGASGGAQSVVLAESNIPSHQHYIFRQVTTTGAPEITTNQYPATWGSAPLGFGSAGYIMTGVADSSNTGLTSSYGSGQAHNNVQPSSIVNYLIKL